MALSLSSNQIARLRPNAFAWPGLGAGILAVLGSLVLTSTSAMATGAPAAKSAQVEDAGAARPERTTIRVTINAVPPPGVKWTKIAMNSERVDSTWRVSSDGTKFVAELGAGISIFRTVGRAKSGQLYFSEFRQLKISVADVIAEKPLSIDFATTLPALDLKGRVDLSVPRPVKNGFAMACVTTGVSAPDMHRWLMWSKTAPVHADGTFEIANLPPPTAPIATDDSAGPLQLIVTCEGYSSKDADAGSFEYAANSQTFVPPITLPLTIAMEPTGRARVRVLDPDGKPVPHALVQFAPNETFRSGTLLWYSTMLGSEWDDEKQFFREEPMLDLKPGELLPYQRLQAKYQATTDSNGVAELSDLPEGLVPFTVEKTPYDMPYRQRMMGSPSKYAQDAVLEIKPGQVTSAESI